MNAVAKNAKKYQFPVTLRPKSHGFYFFGFFFCDPNGTCKIKGPLHIRKNGLEQKLS